MMDFKKLKKKGSMKMRMKLFWSGNKEKESATMVTMS